MHELVQHTGVRKTRAALPGRRGLKTGASFRQSLLPGVTGCLQTSHVMRGRKDKWRFSTTDQGAWHRALSHAKRDSLTREPD